MLRTTFHRHFVVQNGQIVAVYGAKIRRQAEDHARNTLAEVHTNDDPTLEPGDRFNPECQACRTYGSGACSGLDWTPPHECIHWHE